MKTALRTLLIAAVALLAAACQKDTMPETIKASAEQAKDDSKLSMTERGRRLLWDTDDSIAVHRGSSKASIYRLSSGAGTTEAEFVKVYNYISSGNTYYAIHPASISNWYTTVKLPAIQHSPDGSLHRLPMYSVSDAPDNLLFYSMCAIVRFRISATAALSLSSIQVTVDSAITGTLSVRGSGAEMKLRSTLRDPDLRDKQVLLSLDTPQDISSARNFYMYIPAYTFNLFRVKLVASNGATCTKTASTSIMLNRGQITTITLTDLDFTTATEGVLSGRFSVAPGSTVRFSKGNLQYQASTGTWRFAEHQWDTIGAGNANISSTYSGWIDLFGWGTSGWDNGNYFYMPYDKSQSYTSPYTERNGYGYGPSDGTDAKYDLTGAYANADWGVYNAISNGGNQAGLWRTLTADEWYYLGSQRSASTVNGTANARWIKATVNGVCGLILFPDSYTHPDGVAQPVGINSGSQIRYENNNYSQSDWTLIEAAGAVFLPAAGQRVTTTSVSNVGKNGYYWSSTRYDLSDTRHSFASQPYFEGTGTAAFHYTNRSKRQYGASVRLVCD
ncbi:MAG: hypothetical protein IJU81_00765 [Bacteroidales bacterium]|nr:hypothetical protein [Bacteroidales bacterium]